MNRLVSVAVAVLAVGTATAQKPAATRVDLLDLPSGAMVVSATSEYGGAWKATRLVDGGTEAGWCSEGGKAAPNTIVVELAQPFAIKAIAIDNTGAQESGYAGISARQVVVSGSTTSATAGFAEIATIEAAKGGRKEVALAGPATAQWLRFEVRSNWGHAEYTELMELEAYGEPVGPAPKVSVAGVFQTNYGAMRLEQDGVAVRGCYDCCGIGQLTGNLDGRVLRFEWREDEGKDVGTAMMIVSTAGDALNGVYFRGGELNGEWSGYRVTGREADCTVATGSGLAEKLEATGKAVLYGLYFDPDSAVLKAESEPTLEEIAAVLKRQEALRLQVAGHTDSTNTDAYNLKLSQQRAEAVVTWLTAHGVAAGRLVAKGFGESQPVADNKTASGRALNRRVEVTKM
jgi:outer membrane protein OmpA-like peptidoglycan-associated protein